MSEKHYRPVVNILPPIQCNWSVGVYLERFYQDLEKKKLTGIKCPKCGKVYAPPRKFCSDCGVPMKSFVPLKDTGEIINYTVCCQNVNGSRRDEPIVIGLVRLDGADTGIYGEIRPAGAKVEVGIRVRAVFADKPGVTVGSLSHFEPVSAK